MKRDCNCCKGCENGDNKKSYTGYQAFTGNNIYHSGWCKRIYHIKWIATAADNVTYKVTHEFYFRLMRKTKAEESKTEEYQSSCYAAQITASSYEAEGI